MTTEKDEHCDIEFDRLSESFIASWRNGLYPGIDEYADEHPLYADKIRDLFPALVLAEQLNHDAKLPRSDAKSIFPRQFGSFTLHREVGRGGMGIVYEASQNGLASNLAVKVMKNQDLPSHLLKERFAREAEAASRLHHSNIVPLRQYGQHDNCHFISMALIDGISLDRLLNDFGTSPKSKALSDELDRIRSDWTRVAQMGAVVAGALGHAHESGMIHRDLKPANLILDHDHKIWVTDFGLAKLMDQKNPLSKSGELIGTPTYMAPEQLLGFADARSDVYGIGLTLYELITGVRPWAGVEKEKRAVPGIVLQIPDIQMSAPDVPKKLAKIINKACSHHPESRFQSAWELEYALNEFAYPKKANRRGNERFHTTYSIWGNRLVHYASLLCIFACTWLCIQSSSQSINPTTRQATSTSASMNMGITEEQGPPPTNCIRFVDPETGLMNVLAKVSSRYDDVEEKSEDGEMYLDSRDLELTWDGVAQTIGIRFAGVKVPPGATIRHAHLVFHSRKTDIVETNLEIHGLAAPNPPSFLPLPYNLTKRATMPETVLWAPGPWTKGAFEQSSDCRIIVQNAVDHPQWKSGNAIGFMIKGDGYRRAYTFDGNVPSAPSLKIEYEIVTPQA